MYNILKNKDVKTIKYSVKLKKVQFTFSQTVVQKLLEKGKYPIIFLICLRPGLNATKLNEFGYSDTERYFIGNR